MAHLLLAITRVEEEVKPKATKEMPQTMIDSEVIILIIQTLDKEEGCKDNDGEAGEEEGSGEEGRERTMNDPLHYQGYQCQADRQQCVEYLLLFK